MSGKQLVISGKTWMHVDCREVSPSGFIVRFINSLRSRIAVGYQDESGFHMGGKNAKAVNQRSAD
jgi:hypothetical protein